MSIKKSFVNDIDEWKLIKNPLLEGIGSMEIITSANTTIGRAIIDSPVKLKSHHHNEEQITVVIEGAMEICIEGEKRIVKNGGACIIPSNREHEVEIIEVPFLSFDIFTPYKKDYIEKIRG